MKNILKVFAALSLLCLLSCKSASKPDEIPDAYGDEAEISAIKIEKQPTAAKKDVSSDPYNAKKMRGENRSVTERIFNLNKYQKIEDFSTYLKPMIGKMFLRKGHLIHRSGTDIGGFLCYYDSSAYAVQFATHARAALLAAVDQYFKDFDEKKLDKKAKRTDRAYGSTTAYEDYGVIENMMMYYAKPKVYFGYLFSGDSPYFVVYVQRAKNLATNTDNEEGKLKEYTVAQRYYFTKAQAKRLATFLSDENINALQNATVSKMNPKLDEEAYAEKHTETETAE